MWEINYLANTAFYNCDVKDTNINALQKQVLSKIGAIYNYTFQQQQINPEYKYDNDEEYQELKANIAQLTASKKSNFTDRIIPDIMEIIEKNSIYGNTIEEDKRNGK